MLKGQAKTDYQRNYMRKRRLLDPSVRPIVEPRPGDIEIRSDKGIQYWQVELDADGNPIYEEG